MPASFIPDTTNAIESLNARFRRAVRHRGHFPNEQAALKVLYLVATTWRPNRENLTGRISGWKSILNTLTVHYGDRLTINDYHAHLHKKSDSPAARTVRDVHDAVDAEDPSTADLLHGIIDQLEKQAWMLNAENRPA